MRSERATSTVGYTVLYVLALGAATIVTSTEAPAAVPISSISTMLGVNHEPAPHRLNCAHGRGNVEVTGLRVVRSSVRLAAI